MKAEEKENKKGRPTDGEREWLIGPYDCAVVRDRSSTEVITLRSPEFIRVSRREELVQSAFFLR